MIEAKQETQPPELQVAASSLFEELEKERAAAEEKHRATRAGEVARDQVLRLLKKLKDLTTASRTALRGPNGQTLIVCRAADTNVPFYVELYDANGTWLGTFS